jgi:long-chain acyl-CoA synthetase
VNIAMLLEMVAEGDPDRVVVGSKSGGLTAADLLERARRAGVSFAKSGAEVVGYFGLNADILPVALFGAAFAGVPFSPINYRAPDEQLKGIVSRVPGGLMIADPDEVSRLHAVGADTVVTKDEFAASLDDASLSAGEFDFVDPESIGVLLFTSGTTSEPKAAVLRHRHLVSYIITSVEFLGCSADEAQLICVPPYHIAGVGAALSNLYAGRKMVYLPNFDAQEWVRLIDAEHVTTATVVPTMLDRIVAVLETGDKALNELTSLRNLAYGGSKVGLPLVRRALQLLPDVGFVNAYGLTETSSTIAVLTPDDHRAAQAALSSSNDAAIAKRLGSVGQPVPGIELQIRGEDGTVLAPGETGELFVRGEQVSGRYTGIGSVLDEDGWFPTRDVALLDEDGYLFIGGRSDDTIIRGGENIAPAELEEVLLEHSHVRDVAVVGVEDPQWGQAIVAVVVPAAGIDPDPEELREHVRKSLRGSRTPDRVVFRDELPTTPTGKVLRREIVQELRAAPAEQ